MKLVAWGGAGSVERVSWSVTDRINPDYATAGICLRKVARIGLPVPAPLTLF